MGFLNLSAWRPVGGRRIAERRATVVQSQPPRFYYDHLRDFQAVIDRYFEIHGHRPKDVAELYLWQLESEGAMDDDQRARDLADLFSYYDIEQSSLLGMVAVFPDHAGRAQSLLEARRAYRLQGQRPPEPTPVTPGLA